MPALRPRTSKPAQRSSGVRTPKQRAGDAAEQAAERHLAAHGCVVLARNARYRVGELDLVVRDRESIVFVEVRMRSASNYGGAAASVDTFKQKRLVRAAQIWLTTEFGERWPACRFDVVAVDRDGTIEWLRDAFAT
jgi:putative endonuclease